MKIYANAIDGASKLNERFGGTLNFLLGDAGKKAKDTAPELDDLADAADDVAWSVKGGRAECSINGAVVAGYDQAELVAAGKLTSLNGVYGIRAAHNVDLVVSGFEKK